MTLRYKLTWTHASKSLQLRPLPTPQLSTNVLLEAKGRHRIIQYRFSHQAEDCLENFVLVLSAKKYRGVVAIVSVKNLTFAIITYS